MSVLKLSTVLLGVFVLGSVPAKAEGAPTIMHGRSIPLSLVLDDIGEHFQEEPSSFTIKQNALGSVEAPNRLFITVEEKTPTDDSVAAVRYKYDLSNHDGTWVIKTKETLQKCAEGRGQLFFSKRHCR